VDLLTNVLPSGKIDGFLIAHGHQVTNESTEAFILRIYTSQKKQRDQCFIKAFSDAPEGLLQGFSKVDKTLKALQVRNLYLYPRFHQAVQEELDEYAPHVEELQQTLSPSMKEIQSAIVAALQTCLRELKSATAALVDWTGDELKIENCAMPNFHQTVKRQLEKDWHRIKPQTRQLVEDLRTLGTLFHILIQSDCVRFWSVLNLIKTNSAGSRYPSLWLLTPAADRLFRKAKDRIYKIQPGVPTPKVLNPVSRLIPVLEENPKWRLLRTVLTEIRQLHANKKSMSSSTLQQRSTPSTILVLVKDAASVKSLRSYLTEGRDRALASKFLDYLVRYNDRTRSVVHGKIMSEESRLLHEEEARVRRVLQVNRKVVAQKQKQSGINVVPDYMRKRRRIALEKGRGEITGGLEDRERSAVLDDAMEQADHDLQESGDHIHNPENQGAGGDDIYNNMFQASFVDEPRIIIRSFDAFDGDQTLILADLDPDYVIMYDMDVRLVRSLEVYSAMMGRNDDAGRLMLYLLSFDASAEQKVFQKSLEREQSAFVRLIHHKKTMPPPVLRVEGTQEMQQALATGVVNTYAGGTLPLAMDTRRGQGQGVSG
jgi:DNA excision repair protein ERCC-4